jgi:hypothetical protein
MEDDIMKIRLHPEEPIIVSKKSPFENDRYNQL